MLCLLVHLENTVCFYVFHIQKWVQTHFHLFHILNFLDYGAHFLKVLARLHEVFDALLFFGDGRHYLTALLVLDVAELMQETHLLLV